MNTARRQLCIAGLLAALGAQAQGERRAALVIGNGSYRVGPLKNPVNDAQAVAAQLRALGFEVMQRENLGLRDMIESFRQFSISARSAAVRLVFYAGHGVQVKGRNYLLPVDTEIRGEDEMPAKSADLNELLDRLAAIKQGINIFILDACRNNPFSGTEVLGPDGRRLKFRGLAAPGLALVQAPLGLDGGVLHRARRRGPRQPEREEQPVHQTPAGDDADAGPADRACLQAGAPGRGARNRPRAGAMGKLEPDGRLLLQAKRGRRLHGPALASCSLGRGRTVR